MLEDKNVKNMTKTNDTRLNDVKVTSEKPKPNSMTFEFLSTTPAYKLMKVSEPMLKDKNEENMTKISVTRFDDAKVTSDNPKPNSMTFELQSTTPGYKSDLIVLLDIDRTLVYTESFPSIEKAALHVAAFPKDENGKIVDFTAYKHTSKSIIWVIALRPGLHEFIRHVATSVETHIYTAGTRWYAEAVAKVLDPDGVYFGKRIWCDTECMWGSYLKNGNPDKNSVFHKDLSKLSVSKDGSLRRVVLVDDDWKRHLLANLGNMLSVTTFTNDPTDTELKKVLSVLIKLMDSTVDVRSVLIKKMPEEVLLQLVKSVYNE